MDHNATAPNAPVAPRHVVPPVQDLKDPIPEFWVLPPQEGVKPREIGRFRDIPTQIHVKDRDATAATARLTSWQDKEGKVHAKLFVGDKRDGQPRPGIAYRGSFTHPEGQQFGNHTLERIHLGSDSQGSYLTDNAADPQLVKGYRAVVVSVPGALEFGIPKEGARLPAKPGIKVLVQGHEEIRVQPGHYLTKAVLAVPVDESGKPKEAEIHALRQFGKQEKPLLTPKFSIAVDAAGEISVSQVDGLKAVKLDREVKKQAGTAPAVPAAVSRPATPTPAATAPAKPVAPPVPAVAAGGYNADNEPPF